MQSNFMILCIAISSVLTLEKEYLPLSLKKIKGQAILKKKAPAAQDTAFLYKATTVTLYTTASMLDLFLKPAFFLLL